MTEKSQASFYETTLVKSLKENAEKVKFGEVSLTLRIHDGRIVAVTNSVTENTIQKGGTRVQQS